MLDESAVGLSVEQDFSYTWRDLILYNLSVGAKQEELEYVYEKGLKAVRTFGVIPPGMEVRAFRSVRMPPM